MQTFSFIRPSRRPAVFSGLLAALLIASLVAFPSMRAAADTFLQSFRADSLLFVPVDQSRIQQIEQAAGDPTSLFLTKPNIVGEPTNTRVQSAADAAKLVSFAPQQPDAFPSTPTDTRYTVHGQMQVQAQVNVENTRKLLQALNINDVTLPDSLGSAPVTADVPATLGSDYTGEGYHFVLLQGTTPTVNLPKGVDLTQLGKAGLRLLGMQPDQADKLSRQIDWSTTLVVPFPTDMDNVVHVQVNGADGLMVTAPNESVTKGSDDTSTVIYWQQGERFFVLSAGGAKVTPDAALILAKSVK